MNPLRVGTRGSALALWQTNWVCNELRGVHPGLEIEQIVIRTHGDQDQQSEFGTQWPVGAFVSALETALMEERIDFAVHSYKDLQTLVTTGLNVSAIPPRAPVHDVLVTRTPMELDALPDGYRIGTGSPRRSAQLRRIANVEIIPIRGNVQTRIDKIDSDGLDAVVLAAAGLDRLGITPANVLPLPVDRVVPSPAQGALAIQTRAEGEARDRIAALDDAATRRQVTAERSFLRAINAGCHVPVGALASLDGETVTLHAQLFDDTGTRLVEGHESGTDPEAVGKALATRLLDEL